MTSREETFWRDTCVGRNLFWLCLDQSTPIFWFRHFDSLTNFLKLTLSRSVHANFFSGIDTLTTFRSIRSELRPIRSRFRPIRSEFRPIDWNSVQSDQDSIQSDRNSIHSNRNLSHSLILQFFLWLNIDQAITVTSFVYETNIDFFYSRTFQHLFRRLDVTLHSPLQIRQAR